MNIFVKSKDTLMNCYKYQVTINKAILNSNQGIWPISDYEKKLYE